MLKLAMFNIPVDVEKLSAAYVKKLAEGGFEKAEDVLDAGTKGLQDVKGIGEKTAAKIISIISEHFEDVV